MMRSARLRTKEAEALHDFSSPPSEGSTTPISNSPADDLARFSLPAHAAGARLLDVGPVGSLEIEDCSGFVGCRDRQAHALDDLSGEHDLLGIALRKFSAASP